MCVLKRHYNEGVRVHQTHAVIFAACLQHVCVCNVGVYIRTTRKVSLKKKKYQ